MRASWVVAVIVLGFSTLITLIQGCGAPMAALGTTSVAAGSSVGTTAASAAVANPMTATSLASTVTTGKSPLEHAASAATKKECSFFHLIDGKSICVDVVMPKIIDNSAPYPGPADQK